VPSSLETAVAKHHPNKEVSDAIAYALSLGWRFVKGSGHRFGTLLCPQADRSGCRVGVASTPQNPGQHARRIRHDVDRCVHQ
jgi:hypothetical protein